MNGKLGPIPEETVTFDEIIDASMCDGLLGPRDTVARNSALEVDADTKKIVDMLAVIEDSM
jgi:hypothetical protein